VKNKNVDFLYKNSYYVGEHKTSENMAKGQKKQKGGRDTQLPIIVTAEEKKDFDKARGKLSRADFLMLLLKEWGKHDADARKKLSK